MEKTNYAICRTPLNRCKSFNEYFEILYLIPCNHFQYIISGRYVRNPDFGFPCFCIEVGFSGKNFLISTVNCLLRTIMRLWLSKNSEVSIREQLVSQIILGIISTDLTPGQKLPSTREMGRRFHIHANTVVAAYRELNERGWIELRQGSGAYVREKTTKNNGNGDAKFALDQLTTRFLSEARAGGFSIQAIKSSVRYWLNLQPPDHVVVVESDEALRDILIAEIQEGSNWQVVGISIEECRDEKKLAGALPVTLSSRAEAVRSALPQNFNCHLLHLNSVPGAMQGKTLPPPDALVAVVSGWADFLRWSHAVLIAVGIEEAVLNLRLTNERGWRQSLRGCAFVITDVVTAKEIPVSCDTRVFRLIAENSLQELREFMPNN